MHIGIDARTLTERRTGLGRYLINLLPHFAQLAPENKYTLYCRPDSIRPDFLDQPCFEQRILISSWLPSKRTIWEQVLLPAELRRDKPDILLAPSYTVPMFPGCKVVATIHDIIHVDVKGSLSSMDNLIYRLFSDWAVKISRKIITVSDFSKRRIIERYRVPAEKIEVILEANDPIFAVVEDKGEFSRVRRKYGVTETFILYVGTMLNRRRIPTLLEAFRKLTRSDVQLVMVGSNQIYPPLDIGSLIGRLELKQRVVWLDYVPDTDLVLLYNNARLFVYVSSYEGFGLPVLEAMACGCPVITSNVTSLPEVAGDAALLVSPGDVHQLAAAMERVLANGMLRELRIAKGLERAKMFSWSKAAEETLRVLEEACLEC